MTKFARATGFDEQFLLQVGDNKDLTLLKAGYEDDTYPHRVRAFEWETFYKKYGSFFVHFRQHLTSKFQYVFIDSRTGLTDTSGICTRVMPEKLVGVFAPNRQNLEGLKGVISRALEHRRDSRDPRGLIIFPLASRIDAAASKLRKTWWTGGKIAGKEVVGYEKIFEDLFVDIYELDDCNLHDYFDATQIPHDSDYAYGEEIAARYDLGTSDKLSIATACTNLAERLVTLEAPWETLPEHAKLAEAQRHAEEAAVKARELETREYRSRKLSITTVTLALLVVVLGVSWGLWQRRARMLAQAEAERTQQAEKYNTSGSFDLQNNDYESALRNFNEAIKLKPDYAEAYLNRARARRHNENSEQALSDYIQAIQLKPDLAVAYVERAALYRERGEYDLALADYSKAISIRPDDWRTYIARAQLYEERQNYKMAIDDYTRVIRSDADQLKASAYLYRGLDYQRLGLKQQAIDDFLKATALSPNSFIRYKTADSLRELGYVNTQPENYVPPAFTVFLEYENVSDGPIVDAVSERLRGAGFTVQPKEYGSFSFSLGMGGGEVAYYSKSQVAQSIADKVLVVVKQSIVEKGYLKFAPKANYRGQVDPYVPRGNIDVWIPSLARTQELNLRLNSIR